jgi:hypothetical protein
MHILYGVLALSHFAFLFDRAKLPMAWRAIERPRVTSQDKAIEV